MGLLALLVLGAVLPALSQDSSPSPAVFTESESDLLLTFKAGITNWDEVASARKMQGWTDCNTDPACLPVCNWSGVECNPYLSQTGNFVTALRLPCRDGCTMPLRGRLTPGIHRLPHLAYLHLDGNQLSGPLPEAWGEPHAFKELLELNLNNNQLTGNLPPVWSIGPAFESLADLQLAGNRLSGPFPAGFAVTNTSFWSVMSFNFANNQMTGPLPDYINGMITMSIVRLENNLFTGTLPPQWGTQGYFWNYTYNTTQALEYLTLHGNRLSGTLPPEWGVPGSFMVLKQLTLSDNPGINGTLPAAWGGSSDSLPALEDLNVSNTALSGQLPTWGPYPASLRMLTIYSNNLTGSIPASWSQLSALQDVILQPGNPNLCPILPAGATFQVCTANDVLCLRQPTYNSTLCTSYSASSGGPTSSSSFPIAAVAVPVAVAGVTVLVMAGFLWQRRQQRLRAAEQKGNTSRETFYQDPETGLFYPVGGKKTPDPGAQAGFMAVAANSQGPGMGDCLSCLGKTHSAELEEVPSMSTATGSAGAQSAPAWLAASQPPLQQFASGVSIPQPSASASDSSKGQPPEFNCTRSVAASSNSTPCLPHQQPSILPLSDWEISSDEIEILKRADGSEWVLGSGGFGTVYKAMRNGVQPVAVKALGSANTEVLKAMTDTDFAHEISILRACRDTNILQFQGVCFQGNRTLLVTEFMEGGNLAHNLRAKKVNWYRKGKKIAIDVARALVYLHSRRILHNDIKSANVLLTRDGTAKVGDVGMAKIMAGDYLQASGMVGTLAWSAPELLLGQRCGKAADVYSLGVVLWEIVTGEVPVRGQLRDPRVPEECPAEVMALMYRCLSPDPAVRPTATEVVERLMEAGSVPLPALLEPGSAPSAMLPSTSTMTLLAGAGSPTGSLGPATKSISEARVQHSSQHRNVAVEQETEGPAPGATEDGAPGSAPAADPALVAGRCMAFPQMQQLAHASTSQAALEESLVSELAEELSREALKEPSAPEIRVAVQQRQHGALRSSRRSRRVGQHDPNSSLQRRLVLSAAASHSSPFTRFNTSSPPTDPS